MSQLKKSISKQALAWTAVFALVLSVLPYTVADQNSDEYFESWSYELLDTDGDDQDDTVIFTFDVDTNVSDYAEVEVNMNVIDANGNYVGGENEDYEIYWTENDTFQMEWFVDDCYEEDDDGCEAPYDFSFTLYEIDDNGYYYYEDNFSEADIWLNETTIIPEGIVQVENGVFSDDIDGYHQTSGTSFATPRTAGLLSKIIQNLRFEFNDNSSGADPFTRSGMMINGTNYSLSNDDLRDALNRSGWYPSANTWDPTSGTMPISPLAPCTQVGWGVVNESNVEPMIKHLNGTVLLPDRPFDVVQCMEMNQAMRETYWG